MWSLFFFLLTRAFKRIFSLEIRNIYFDCKLTRYGKQDLRWLNEVRVFFGNTINIILYVLL